MTKCNACQLEEAHGPEICIARLRGALIVVRDKMRLVMQAVVLPKVAISKAIDTINDVVREDA